MNINKELSNCQEVQRLILLFPDLDNLEQAEVLEHTHHCSDCHGVLKQQDIYWNVMEQVSKQVPQVHHASRLTHTIMSHIQNPSSADLRAQVIQWFRIPITVAAILLVIMMLGSVEMKLKPGHIQAPMLKQSSAETPIQHYFKTYKVKDRVVSRYQSYRTKNYKN